MRKYLARRILTTIPVLLGISFIVFALVSFAPGDPISLMLSNETVNVENVAKLKAELGLDRPWYMQYAVYMGKLLKGDMGRSVQFNRPVAEMIGEKIGNTFRLTIFSCVIALIISIPLGVLAAARRRSVLDYSATALALVGVSMPSFYLGLLLILFFGLRLGWLPIRGLPTYDATLLKQIRYLILPSITLGSSMAGILTRLTRACMLEALGQDFARTAKAKGQSEIGVLFKHAFPQRLPALLTRSACNSALSWGARHHEDDISLPASACCHEAVKFRDPPLIQGTVLVFAVCLWRWMLLVDICTSSSIRGRYD